MKLIDLEQGSYEWLEWRGQHFTASDCAAMLGISPYKTPLQLYNEKKGKYKLQTIDSFTEQRLRLGHEVETKARDYINLQGKFKFKPYIGMLDESLIAASFDGVCDNSGVILEVKLASKATLSDSNEAIVPEYYMAQIQQQLLVSDAPECLYAVAGYAPENPKLLQINTQVIKPCKEWESRILQGWDTFNHWLKEDIPPKPTGRDTVDADIDLSNLKALQSDINTLKLELKAKEDEKQNIIQGLGLSFGKYESNGVTLTVSERKGSVDYSKVPELKGVNLEAYRKNSTTSYLLKIK